MPTPSRPPREAGFSMIELLISTVIMAIVLGMVLQILASLQSDYLERRRIMEIQTNAQTGLDNMVRLIRMAGSDPEGLDLTPIDADPDGNDAYDSISIEADWNPADGDIADPYEDVTFTTAGDVLMLQEGAGAATPFLEGISSVTFTYLDADGATIADPVANVDDIVLVRISVTTRTVGNESVTFTSSAAIRSRLD